MGTQQAGWVQRIAGALGADGSSASHSNHQEMLHQYRRQTLASLFLTHFTVQQRQHGAVGCLSLLYFSDIYIYFLQVASHLWKKARKTNKQKNSSCLLQSVKPCVLPVKPGTRCFSTSPCLFALCCLPACVCVCLRECVWHLRQEQNPWRLSQSLAAVHSVTEHQQRLAGSPHCGEAANCALHFIAGLKMPLSPTAKASFWTRYSQKSSPLKKSQAWASALGKKKPIHVCILIVWIRRKRRQEREFTTGQKSHGQRCVRPRPQLSVSLELAGFVSVLTHFSSHQTLTAHNEPPASHLPDEWGKLFALSSNHPGRTHFTAAALSNAPAGCFCSANKQF